MDLTYDRQAILNGNQLRRQAEEQPPTFAEYNGAVDAIPGQSLQLSSSNRKAAPVGKFAMDLMRNPELANAVNNWNGLFQESNQGAEFFATQQAQADEAADTAVMNEIAKREARG